MTWAKYGNEFFNQLDDFDFQEKLQDACQLTHAQAVHFVYSTESMDLMFKKSALRRFASSSLADEAAAELVTLGVWADEGTRYRVVHHEDVIRQSLGYQLKERTRSKKSKRAQRAQGKSEGVPQDVTRDNTRDGMRTQSVSQSFKQPVQEKSPEETLNESTGELTSEDPWTSSMDDHVRCSTPGCPRPVTPWTQKTYGQFCAPCGEDNTSKERTAA